MRIFLFILMMLPNMLNGAETFHKPPTPTEVAIFYSDQFLLHDTGVNHPENADRLKPVIAHLKSSYQYKNSLVWPTFKPATQEILELVHSPAYLKKVEAETKVLGKHALANLSTGDTVISSGTLGAAKLAVGAGIAASDAIMRGQVKSAFALVRPPGHHASRSTGMGFCVYNNVAIAARYLQKYYGIKRILIVDFDVHHGNGTQDIFYEDESVFYFSVHQHPLYPGTGRSSEIGQGKGLGSTLNVELPRGAGDNAILSAIDDQLKPAMVKFKPEFIIVSAGVDSHEGDQLGGLAYSDEGYAYIAKALLDTANQYAQERIFFMLEGGYTPVNITNSVDKMLGVLVDGN
jgi:acetoin utilization deacetylase AcuC-like enzyme